MVKKKKKPAPGDVYFHPISGEGRPWIVKSVSGRKITLYNLDDAGHMEISLGRFMAEFYPLE